MQEITRLANLPVYTKDGTFIGHVKNMVLDLANRRIDGLLVGKTNPDVVEGGRDVNIPYRWVQSFGDIVLLRYFPARVGENPVPPQEEGEGEPVQFEQVEEPAPAPAPPRRRVAARSA